MEAVESVRTNQDFSMEHTPSIAKLTEALSKFQGACPVIVKDKNNPFLKSLYADLGSIVRTINPILAENGLAVVQMPVGENGDLITQVSHSSGEWIRSRYRMKPAKQDPQSVGSSITYAKRYALVAMLNLPVDDEADDDGQKGSAAERSPLQELKDNLGVVWRSHSKKTAEEILAKAGYKAGDVAGLAEKDLRKLYQAFGGDERLAVVAQDRK